MRAVLIVVALAAGGVDAACPCLGSSETLSALAPYISSGDLQYLGVTYPDSYGADACAAFDSSLEPYCANSTGAPLDTRPEWCDDQWCFVDPDNCDLPITFKSTYFPDSDLSYSYMACGNNATFSAWFNATGAGRTIDEVAGLVESYVYAIRDHVETEIANFAAGGCEVPGCTCPTCNASGVTWGDTSVELSATIFKEAAGTSASSQSTCIAHTMGAAFSRIAGSVFDEPTSIGYMYGATQADGAYAQWPALEWCDDFNPRLRPWYAMAASGPKRVVIVADTSGSMAELERITIAREAVQRVIDTFTWRDSASLVEFASTAEVYSETLLQMTDANKEAMKAQAASMTAVGTTNFVAALSAALDILEGGSEYGCINAILFMTDGHADFSDSDYASFISRAEALGLIVFSYALGSDADGTVPKQVACGTEGVFHTVADGGDLTGAMTSYYSYYIAATGARQARWVQYNDLITGVEMLASCAPVYNPALSATDGLNELLAVVCMDVNVFVELEVLSARNDYQDFITRVTNKTDVCLPVWEGLEAEGQTRDNTFEAVRLRLDNVGAQSCVPTLVVDTGSDEDEDDDGGGDEETTLTGACVGADCPGERWWSPAWVIPTMVGAPIGLILLASAVVAIAKGWLAVPCCGWCAAAAAALPTAPPPLPKGPAQLKEFNSIADLSAANDA